MRGQQNHMASGLSCATQCHAIGPGVIIYNAAIRACEAACSNSMPGISRDWCSAAIEPIVITYNTVFGPCVKGQRCQQVLRFLCATQRMPSHLIR